MPRLFNTETNREIQKTEVGNTILKLAEKYYSSILHCLLVSSLEIINIGKTGNQNHPDLEDGVVLVTCISNIEF